VSLTPIQAAVAREEWERLDRSGPRHDPKVSGCFVAFAGMIILTLTPAIGGWLDIPPGLALGILTVAVLLLAGGAGIGLIGGNRQERAAARVRRESVEVLVRASRGDLPSDDGVRAAVRFLHAGGGIRLEGLTDLTPEARALVDRVAHVALREADEG
jgi:hypothetical protein